MVLKIEIWICLYCGSERKGEIKTSPEILIGENGRINLTFSEMGRRYEEFLQETKINSYVLNTLNVFTKKGINNC